MSHFHQGDCTRTQTLRSGEYIHEKKKNLASETCLRIKEPLKIRGWIDFLVFFFFSPSKYVCVCCTNPILYKQHFPSTERSRVVRANPAGSFYSNESLCTTHCFLIGLYSDAPTILFDRKQHLRIYSSATAER